MQKNTLQTAYFGFTNSSNLFLKKNLALPYAPFFLNTENTIPFPETELPYERLGKRAEKFFEHHILSNSDYTIIAKELQIIDQKTTLGEIDFLVQHTESQNVIHVELCYKFYLYDDKTGTTELEHWVGPNKNDSLIQKINKLKNKQFPLLYDENTAVHLKKLQLTSKTIEQKICFLAQLFLPYKENKNPFISINPDAFSGYYVSFENFKKAEFQTKTYFLPNKIDWFSKPKNNDDWFDYQTLLPEIESSILKKRSVLLWCKTMDSKLDCLFITWW